MGRLRLQGHQQSGHRRRPFAPPRLPLLAEPDHLRVAAERRGVDEDDALGLLAALDVGVDAQLTEVDGDGLARARGVDGLLGVVDADVAPEVVERPGGHDGQGQVEVLGHPRGGGHGAVAAGDAQRPHPGLAGGVGEGLGQVGVLLETQHLGAAAGRSTSSSYGSTPALPERLFTITTRPSPSGRLGAPATGRAAASSMSRTGSQRRVASATPAPRAAPVATSLVQWTPTWTREYATVRASGTTHVAAFGLSIATAVANAAAEAA